MVTPAAVTRAPSTDEIKRFHQLVVDAEQAAVAKEIDEKERERALKAPLNERFRLQGSVDISQLYFRDHDLWIKEAKAHKLPLPVKYTRASQDPAKQNFLAANVDNSQRVVGRDDSTKVEADLHQPFDSAKAAAAPAPWGKDDPTIQGVLPESKDLLEAMSTAGSPAHQNMLAQAEQLSKSKNPEVAAAAQSAVAALNAQVPPAEVASLLGNNPLVSFAVAITTNDKALYRNRALSDLRKDFEADAKAHGMTPEVLRSTRREEARKTIQPVIAKAAADLGAMEKPASIPDDIWNAVLKGAKTGKFDPAEAERLKQAYAGPDVALDRATGAVPTPPGIAKVNDPALKDPSIVAALKQGKGNVEAAVQAAGAAVIAGYQHLPSETVNALVDLQATRTRNYFARQNLYMEIASLINSNMPIELVVMLVMKKFHQLAEFEMQEKMKEMAAAEAIRNNAQKTELTDVEDASVKKQAKDAAEKAGKEGSEEYKLEYAKQVKELTEKTLEERRRELSGAMSTFGLRSPETLAQELAGCQAKLKQLWDILSAIQQGFAEMISSITRRI